MTTDWNRGAAQRRRRLEAARERGLGKLVPAERAVELLETVLAPGDRLCVEGNNQKHADFLSACLAKVDPARVHGLHVVQSNLALPQHLDVFERGIAARHQPARARPVVLRWWDHARPCSSRYSRRTIAPL